MASVYAILVLVNLHLNSSVKSKNMYASLHTVIDTKFEPRQKKIPDKKW